MLHPPAPQNVARQVLAIAEPVCRFEGLELVHVEFQRESGGKVLRIYIDRPEGVTLEDCVQLSRSLGDLLDVNLGEIGPYRMEITSPGPSRPVSKKPDFDRFKGRRIRIKTSRALEGQRNFCGLLMGIIDDQVQLAVGDQTVAIPYTSILKANLNDQNGEV